MRAKYDPEVDILYLRLSDAPIADSESFEPNLVLDRDADGNVIGIEVLHLSHLAGADPRAMTFTVADPAPPPEQPARATEAAE
jgi:uncharacterized protein YuzE